MTSCCRSIGKRLKSALLWVLTSAVVCGLVLGILYGKIFLPNLFAVFVVDKYIIFLEVNFPEKAKIKHMILFKIAVI